MGDTTADSREGSQFGPYLLRRLVGRGGMGDVYEAEDTVRERIVALKLMSQTLSNDPVFRARMQREARTAGRLQEPHVVPIHDFGEIDGQLYVDMRLIEGSDVATLLNSSGSLAPPRAVAIVRQIGSALDAAHAAGVLHRDVKPENILGQRRRLRLPRRFRDCQRRIRRKADPNRHHGRHLQVHGPGAVQRIRRDNAPRRYLRVGLRVVRVPDRVPAVSRRPGQRDRRTPEPGDPAA